MIEELIYLESQNFKSVLGVYKSLFEESLYSDKDVDEMTYICYHLQSQFYEERLNFLFSLL